MTSKTPTIQGQPAAGLSRRALLTGAAGAAAVGLAGCGSQPSTAQFRAETPLAFRPLNRQAAGLPPSSSDYAAMYASKIDEGYVIPAVPYQKIDPVYYRQVVDDPTGEAPGTLVVNTAQRFLFLVQENGKAMRYGVGIGRAGFSWSGRAIIEWKQKWPKWFPPAEMIARQPELAEYSEANGGMEAGLANPLGARALYIYQDGKDTLYRLHGSPEWWSIGKAVSSGCVRFINQDIIDLYDRVPEKSPIVVI